LGLTQKEVAFLLGAQDGTSVSRFEGFRRSVSLETALAYEAIFDEPVSNLFPGIYEDRENQLRERARELLKTLKRGAPGTMAHRKYQVLAAIAGVDLGEK
jgi:transcriptional regulator with XRE-family HTH domain